MAASLIVQHSTPHGASQITAVGAVYDLIWHLELLPFRDDEPLDELVVRGVLMALASYLNHQQLKAHKYHVYPSDELLANQIGRSPKTVSRVLDYLLRTKLLVLVRAELRPGRGRAGRPPIYSLPIDIWQRWPKRAIRRSRDDGSDTGVQAITAETPVSNGSDTGVEKKVVPDTGVQSKNMVRTPVSTEPGHSGNPAIVKNPANEPDHARTRARHIDQDRPTFQTALPGQAAVGLSGLEQRAAPVISADALGEGQRIWGAARQELFRVGLDRALEQRLRNTGTAGYDSAAGVLMLDGDLVAEDLAPGSPVMTTVATAAGRELKVQLVGGIATQHVPAAIDKPATGLDRGRVASGQPATGLDRGRVASGAGADQSDEAADRRARFEEGLSAEDRALLQELERRRLAYIEAGEVEDTVNAAPISPPANAIDEATSDSGRATSAEVTAENRSGAPRRRRKKELVA